MLFWLFVIILVIGIVLLATGENAKKYYKDCYNDKKTKKAFLYSHRHGIKSTGAWTFGLSLAILVIMVFILCCQYIGIDAQVEKNKEIYEGIKYKVTSESCRDEFGLLSKEVVDEVQEWNKDVKYYQAIQDNFWVGIFYPNVFDQFETIDYEEYNTGK